MDIKEKINYANDLIKAIIESPSTLKFKSETYQKICRIDEKFNKIFIQTMTERLDEIENPFELCINITWIESLRAELCIIGLTPVSSYINDLAERILFVNREQTIIFVIIFHKLSLKLRSEDPTTFNRCCEYLKQLIGILPASNEFWEPDLSQIEEELKTKIYRKQLENFQFKVDENSLTRAKFVFQKAFEERDYISMALSKMPNNLGLRLLKVHLGYLCKIKFVTEKLEFDLTNEESPRNAKTSTLVRLVGKFYEFDIINSQTIMEIFNHLIKSGNSGVQAILCLSVSDRVREEKDPMLENTKNFILQIFDACEAQEEKREKRG